MSISPPSSGADKRRGRVVAVLAVVGLIVATTAAREWILNRRSARGHSWRWDETSYCVLMSYQGSLVFERVFPLPPVATTSPGGTVFSSSARIDPHIRLPYWVPITLGVLPAIWLIGRRLRRRPFGDGLCQQCGYDLRATPERCPECGEVTTIHQQT